LSRWAICSSGISHAARASSASSAASESSNISQSNSTMILTQKTGQLLLQPLPRIREIHAHVRLRNAQDLCGIPHAHVLEHHQHHHLALSRRKRRDTL